ncbi:MAG: FMN-binding negative transcriptional regulator [Bacteroidetes bacterium]|nr:FMN-binding negative transcriptional regulator [Bacteroidota bacterium]
MYAPSHYSIKNQEQLLAFIKEFPFAVFILKEDEFPLATHIPMEVVMEDDKLFLYGHISNMNPQASFIEKEGVKALAVFFLQDIRTFLLLGIVTPMFQLGIIEQFM